MKALALMLLGTLIGGFAFLKFIESRGSGSEWLGLVGIGLGVLVLLCGLVMNHHDHTRRK